MSNFCAQLSKFIWAEHFHYLSSKHKNIFTLSITGGAYEWWYDPQDTYIYMCNIVGCDTETMNDRWAPDVTIVSQ